MSQLPPNPHPVSPRLVEPRYPMQAHIDFVLTGWGPGYARFEVDLQAFHMNRHGKLHGGVYAIVLDSAMGFSGAYTGDPEDRILTMTLSMTTNFLAPAEGPRLVGEGWRTGGGRRTFFTEGRMTDGTGRLVATATGTFQARPWE